MSVAIEQDKHIDDEINTQHHQLKETYSQKAKNRLAKVHESEEEYKNETIAHIASLRDEQLEGMNRNYNESCDKWVQILFDNIIGEYN